MFAILGLVLSLASFGLKFAGIGAGTQINGGQGQTILTPAQQKELTTASNNAQVSDQTITDELLVTQNGEIERFSVENILLYAGVAFFLFGIYKKFKK